MRWSPDTSGRNQSDPGYFYPLRAGGAFYMNRAGVYPESVAIREVLSGVLLSPPYWRGFLHGSRGSLSRERSDSGNRARGTKSNLTESSLGHHPRAFCSRTPFYDKEKHVSERAVLGTNSYLSSTILMDLVYSGVTSRAI